MNKKMLPSILYISAAIIYCISMTERLKDIQKQLKTIETKIELMNKRKND